MVNKKELHEAINGYTVAWKSLFNSNTPADQHEETGIAMRWEDSLFPFSNAAFLTDEISDPLILKQHLNTVAARMRSRQHGGLLNICNDLITGEAKLKFDQILKDAGLEFVMTLDSMAGDILPLELNPIPELQVKRVRSAKELRAFSDMNCLAYGFDVEWGRNALGNVWIDHAYSFVGYVDDQPVCAASAAPVGDVLYLALVATRPEAQRKGYSETIVRHALLEGYKATGLTRTLLHATPAGAPVYERIGYYKSANISAYQLIG